MTIINDYYKERENEINRLRIMKEKQVIGDGSARRVQLGENLYGPFEKKNTGEPIIEHNYLGLILDAQSNIRVVIEGLKQRQIAGSLSLCGELILLELDIELSLVKLKNIVVGRKDIIKQNG